MMAVIRYLVLIIAQPFGTSANPGRISAGPAFRKVSEILFLKT